MKYTEVLSQEALIFYMEGHRLGLSLRRKETTLDLASNYRSDCARLAENVCIPTATIDPKVFTMADTQRSCSKNHHFGRLVHTCAKFLARNGFGS